VDGFDAPRSLCASHLANGSGEFNQNHNQPWGVGHWVDEDDWKNKTNDGFPGTITRFVPFFNFFNFVNFGNYLEVHFVDTDKAKNALETFLQYGNCAQAFESLLMNLKPLGKVPGYVNEVRSTNILSIFNEINSQEKGGLRLNSNNKEAQAEFQSISPGTKDEAGGGGVTLSVVKGKGKQWADGAYAYVHVFPTFVSLISSTNNARMASNKIIDGRKMKEAYELIHRLVHELTHGAGKNGSFSHNEMNAAAKSADPLVYDYSAFIKKHCIPKQNQ
jgi:hypothetical protein